MLIASGHASLSTGAVRDIMNDRLVSDGSVDGTAKVVLDRDKPSGRRQGADAAARSIGGFGDPVVTTL